MLGRLARGTYMLTVAVMIVAWAMSATKSSPAEPTNDQPVGLVLLTRRGRRAHYLAKSSQARPCETLQDNARARRHSGSAYWPRSRQAKYSAARGAIPAMRVWPGPCPAMAAAAVSTRCAPTKSPRWRMLRARVDGFVVVAADELRIGSDAVIDRGKRIARTQPNGRAARRHRPPASVRSRTVPGRNSPGPARSSD